MEEKLLIIADTIQIYMYIDQYDKLWIVLRNIVEPVESSESLSDWFLPILVWVHIHELTFAKKDLFPIHQQENIQEDAHWLEC